MSFIKKWYTYQKERFPILTFGIYVLSIVLAVFVFANYQEIKQGTFLSEGYLKIIPMFIVAFLQFFMVRIVDEFKDYEEDCKYRPYRPVPRGLVTLKELKVLFIICVILQLSITLFVTRNFASLTLLLILWLFFALMSKGFFIKKTLDKSILFEAILDEIMMPFMLLFLASFTNQNNLAGFTFNFDVINIPDLWKILLLSYFVSCIVEVARKVRSKDKEEKGVKTYTTVYGIPKAILILTIFETLLALVQFSILGLNFILVIALMYLVIFATNIMFVIKKSRTLSKIVELSANLYIMLVYLSMFLLII